MRADLVRFGDLLKQARESSGLSRRELAALCGTSVDMIEHYEIDCIDVNTRVVVLMATALKRRVQDLIPDLQ